MAAERDGPCRQRGARRGPSTFSRALTNQPAPTAGPSHAEGGKASWFELFFDPVFVLAVAALAGPHLSARQYGRIVRGWVTTLGLEANVYGPHSTRRTKVAQIHEKTGNLRAVQLLPGHAKMDSTVRNLGVDIEDARSLSEGIDP